MYLARARAGASQQSGMWLFMLCISSDGLYALICNTHLCLSEANILHLLHQYAMPIEDSMFANMACQPMHADACPGVGGLHLLHVHVRGIQRPYTWSSANALGEAAAAASTRRLGRQSQSSGIEWL